MNNTDEQLPVNKKELLSWQATWAMAVGGMIGGGIFAVLGLVLEEAGQWFWLSFIIGGIIALCACYAYAKLTEINEEGGGEFIILKKINYHDFAGSLAWLLILGYVLTISVYAYTFGHYVNYAFSLGEAAPDILAVSVITVMAWLNLRGVSDSAKVEIMAVWGKLFVLLALAAIGILFYWEPGQMTQGIESKPVYSAFFGAAIVFMAYEGFQLLAYNYEEIDDAKNTLMQATIIAVASVIVVYVLVALGTTMIVGAETIIAQKEIALAVAGKELMGYFGLLIVTVAAVLSTVSAINATIFSTARLMKKIAEHDELPDNFTQLNHVQVPHHAIIAISTLAAFLTVMGSLDSLVDAASLIFLFSFGSVCAVAWIKNIPFKWVCGIGAVGAALAILALIIQMLSHNFLGFLIIATSSFALIYFRPVLLPLMVNKE